ncbi:MAG: GNAT family N-acetyltransferase, partial [Oscillospiraceae bacterium]|nr:GNAT family N-acetyltransferase [Oscillospiraceae bacterium]
MTEEHAIQVREVGRDQVDRFIDAQYKHLQDKRDSTRAFVAVNADETVVGHFIVEEKTMPPPFTGTDWFIWNIFTLPELRRRGIASALLQGAIRHAERAGVRHLTGSANATLRATAFWYQHNFSLFPYGRKHDDPNKPKEYGNQVHWMLYRVGGADSAIRGTQTHRIAPVDPTQMDSIFGEHILRGGLPFFHDKKEDIFGFAAVDEHEHMVGFITAWATELGAPL